MTAAPGGPRAGLGTVVAVGAAQTLAWASTYYLPAVLSEPIARELGLATWVPYAAFSAALLVAAAVGPFAGRSIDRGRPVLAASSVAIAVGLVALAAVRDAASLVAAWMLLGAGMACGLYEAAFATLVHRFGAAARPAIAGITLLGGFASTVGWPLSAWLAETVGWRATCLAWAALHLALGLPLVLAALRRRPSVAVGDAGPAVPVADGSAAPTAESRGPADASRATSPSPADPSLAPSPSPADAAAAPDLRPAEARLATVALALVFAATWFVSTAMGSHLPRLLQALGATLAGAVAVAALVGPAQVAGRLLEILVLRRWHPLAAGLVAAALHPLAVVALLAAGLAAAPAFVVLHGVGNGILTIAIGTLPLLYFGAAGYGRRQGLLMVPARVLQAGAPWLYGLVLDRGTAPALALSGTLGALALLALVALRLRVSAPRAPGTAA